MSAGDSAKNAGRARQDRHGEVVNAAIRVIAREGLPGATIRSIAREIGYTTGVVTHYFRDKTDLLVAVGDAILITYDDLVADAVNNPDVIAGLHRTCVAPLPTNPDSEIRWRVYAHILASGESEPAFAGAFQAHYTAIRKAVGLLLVRGQQEGVLRADFDADLQADLLCALVDGLALRALTEPSRLTAQRQIAILTAELDGLRT